MVLPAAVVIPVGQLSNLRTINYKLPSRRFASPLLSLPHDGMEDDNMVYPHLAADGFFCRY